MIVAAPVLVLIDPGLVPGPAMIAATVLVVLIAWRERASIDRAGVAWTVAGRVPGTVVGGYAVAALSQRSLELLIGSVLLAAVVLTAGNLHLPRSRPVLLGAGALSGFMGTSTTVGGPPLALVYQQEAGPVIRGTLNGIFVVGSALSIVTLVAVGKLGLAELGSGLAITPGIVVGFVASRNTAARIDSASIRPIVLGGAGLAAALVLIQAAVG